MLPEWYGWGWGGSRAPLLTQDNFVWSNYGIPSGVREEPQPPTKFGQQVQILSSLSILQTVLQLTVLTINLCLSIENIQHFCWQFVMLFCHSVVSIHVAINWEKNKSNTVSYSTRYCIMISAIQFNFYNA